MNFSADLEEA